MRIPKIRDYLVNHYHSENRHTATMMLGPPGIGKSISCLEASERIAEDLDLPFVDYTDQKGEEIEEEGNEAFIFNNLSLVETEPSDILGIPREKGGYVKFMPLLWARLMSENPGILMLDDFLDVQRPDLFSVAYKITLERRAGYLKLHDGVMIVGAANTPEYSSLSQMIPVPLANRMIEVSAERPTINEWSRWMNQTYGDDWDKRTMAFLKRFESEGYLLKVPRETEVLQNFPSPRTWTKAALELTYNGEREILGGLLGPEVGQKLHAFLQVNVNVDDLIEDPMLWDEQSLDAKYMLCTQLATWFSKAKEPRKGFPLMDEMLEESRQFPILAFLAMDTDRLTDLFTSLFKHEEKYSELVSQAVQDKSAISI